MALWRQWGLALEQEKAVVPERGARILRLWRRAHRGLLCCFPLVVVVIVVVVVVEPRRASLWIRQGSQHAIGRLGSMGYGLRGQWKNS
jgi:hypothetical protein